MTFLNRVRESIGCFRAGLKKAILASLGEELLRDWQHEQLIQAAEQMGELEELVRAQRAAGNEATAAVLETFRSDRAGVSPSLASLEFFDELSTSIEDGDGAESRPALLAPNNSSPSVDGAKRRGRPPGSKNKKKESGEGLH